MVKKITISIGICFIIALVLIYGTPNEINIFGAKWCIRDCDEISKQVLPKIKKSITPLDYLSIDELKPRQKIYALKENATVDFIVKANKDISYNITVTWFHNGTRYHGWNNESNNTKLFHSWYSVNKIGQWKIQVVLKWEYKNKTYSKDDLALIEVL